MKERGRKNVYVIAKHSEVIITAELSSRLYMVHPQVTFPQAPGAEHMVK